MVEMDGKLTKDGQKMTKIALAPRDHAPPVGRVAHLPALILQA